MECGSIGVGGGENGRRQPPAFPQEGKWGEEVAPLELSSHLLNGWIDRFMSRHGPVVTPSRPVVFASTSSPDPP